MDKISEETMAKHLANETAAANRAAEVLHCNGSQKLGKFYPVDFALEKDRRIVFWAEVKCRTCSSRDFLDFAVSAAKIAALRSLQETTGIPAVLIVGWTDCLGILTFPCAGHFCDVSGRTDRDGKFANDIEPMIHFPIQAFRRVPLTK